MYIIKDWANNDMFGGAEFDSFEEGWEFIYENVLNEEDFEDFFVVKKGEHI